MDAYYAFSDEAGAYDNHTSDRFFASHPYYVRANVLVEIGEYAEYQKAIHNLNEEMKIPLFEEIKWSDLWSKRRGKPRNDFISSLHDEDISEYFNKVLAKAASMESLKIIMTVTKNGVHNVANKDTMMRFHLQEALQRVNSELKSKGFATFIIDELPEDFSAQTKNICHWLVENGDIVKYSALYSGILFEKSNLSAGIQLADYTAGIFNSFLKSVDSKPGNYQVAKEKFRSYIYPLLRRSITGEIMGYGIREVTRDNDLRLKIKTAIKKEVATQ